MRIALKGLDPRVLPGMTANVSIPVASSENALALPMAAVFTEQGERFVFVKKDDKFERRPVQIGVADYDYAEVLNGVTEGEVVSLETPAGETAIKLAQKPAGDGTNRVLSTGPASGGGGGGTARPAGGARSAGAPVNQRPAARTPRGPGGEEEQKKKIYLFWLNCATSAKSITSAARKSARWMMCRSISTKANSFPSLVHPAAASPP